MWFRSIAGSSKSSGASKPSRSKRDAKIAGTRNGCLRRLKAAAFSPGWQRLITPHGIRLFSIVWLVSRPFPGGRSGFARPASIVEGLESRALLNGFTVISALGNTNAGTFYDAIAHADASTEQSDPNPFVITFDIPDSGVQTIMLQQTLLPITHSVIIDGTTQATSQGETSSTPLIDINGGNLANTDGLVFLTGGNTVEDLVIQGFLGGSGANGFGIVLNGTLDLLSGKNQGPGVNNTIEGNFIGTNAAGTAAAPTPNSGGIDLVNSSYNLIGGLNANGQLTNGNLISGNSQTGVYLGTGTDTHNDIEGNYIGTNVTGLKPIPNGLDGVALVPPADALSDGFASNNIIGDFDPNEMQFDPNGRNIISGNTQDGVYIVGGTGNQVVGNYIGLGADGVTPLGNGEDGVRLEDASSNVVGGTQAGTGNVISANPAQRRGDRLRRGDRTRPGDTRFPAKQHEQRHSG